VYIRGISQAVVVVVPGGGLQVETGDEHAALVHVKLSRTLRVQHHTLKHNLTTQTTWRLTQTQSDNTQTQSDNTQNMASETRLLARDHH